MSEMTECNYCTLKRMKEKASRKGELKVIMGSDHGWITARYSYEDEPSAYFLELTEKCVC